MADQDSKQKSQGANKKKRVNQKLARALKRVIRDATDLSDPKAGNLILPDQVLPPNLFVLPVHSAVVFPTMMAPLNVSDPAEIATVEEALARDKIVGLLGVKTEGDRPRYSDLYKTGIAVRILKRLKMPDGSINVLVHGLKRFEAKTLLSPKPHMVVEAKYLKDEVERSLEMDALTRAVVAHVKSLSDVNPFFTEEMRVAMINAPGPGAISDIVAFALSLPKEDSQDFVETLSVKQRFEKLLVHLRREEQVAGLQKKIQDDVNSKINTMQREFFLKEQLKAIKNELGMEVDGKSQSAKTFRDRIEAYSLAPRTKKHLLEEVTKFETLSEQSPEYNVSRSYLETVCSLPWNVESKDDLNLTKARKILREDHYGLDRVKERIVEFLAVRKLRAAQVRGKKNSPKGSILCLVGPPGVGKTSIGKSVARTMGRKFYRFSLGGMRDEAEIKGHRRTYIGAMPGKIVQALKRTETKNPVIMLDEIDKLGASFQGDPASALLEVLDPEQNAEFMDHYLDVPFDLSNVFFVLTANSTSSIPAALLDRMEVIEIPGYTLEEKTEIAKRYVVPKMLKDHGLPQSSLRFDQGALKKIMMDYAREPGLRSVQKLVEKICRKVATKKVERPKQHKRVRITPSDLEKWIGIPRFQNELAYRIRVPGVTVGLAWTALGGETLFIEAADLPSPGSGTLKVTGNMGEVMTESASIAWSYVKKKAVKDLGMKPAELKKLDVHLHIPSGAIPKDGPSAGITMACALYSLLSKKILKPQLAMTGELSLTGRVLPVGGIKEKLLAAKRAGVSTVILPRSNDKDLREVPKEVKKGLKIKLVSTVDEVLKASFSPVVLK